MKKTLVVTLITILAVSMVACSEKSDITSETTETIISSEISTATENTSETEVLETETITTEEESASKTLGQTLLAVFQEQLATNPEMTAQAIAETIITNESILFAWNVMPVEEGFLMGFSSEITGFKEAVNFAPMIGTIPFTGYVFTLAEDADVELFVSMLEKAANPRWNVCTEAEETVVEAIGNKIFFLMCPTSLEN